MNFNELELDPGLLKGIAGARFAEMLPVQQQTLPLTLAGRDVTVQSQTGSGKTAAFLITIFKLFGENGNLKKRKALIIAPTRELAVQIEKEAKLLGRYLPYTAGCFYGGVGYAQQEAMLRHGVDIIIGTPGRLLDFCGSGKLNIGQVDMLVIDEADLLLEMGFLPDLRRLLKNMRPPDRRQTMLFSATLGTEARGIASHYMNNPSRIEINPEQLTVETVAQEVYHVGNREKMSLLLGLLKKDYSRNALIFANMKHEAARIANRLKQNGYTCEHLTGDLAQSQRMRIIEDFKSGRLPLLVATDVAARGLHVEGLELVINYDLPGDCQNYVHRIGRTARVGKTGKAISLACEKFVSNLEAIESLIGLKIPVQFAEDGLYVKDRSTRSDHDRFRGAKTDFRQSKGRDARETSFRRRSHPSSARPSH